jgi:hypothetical protein
MGRAARKSPDGASREPFGCRRCQSPMAGACHVRGAERVAVGSRPDGPRKIANRALLVVIRRVHAQHWERYGAPRIHAECAPRAKPSAASGSNGSCASMVSGRRRRAAIASAQPTASVPSRTNRRRPSRATVGAMSRPWIAVAVQADWPAATLAHRLRSCTFHRIPDLLLLSALCRQRMRPCCAGQRRFQRGQVSRRQ